MRRVGKLLIEICRCESSCIDFLIRQCIGERLGEEACATTEESVCFKVDDVLKKYVFTGDDGIINFLQMMRNLGMEVELENAGVEEGDLIIIAGYEFEYVI